MPPILRPLIVADSVDGTHRGAISSEGRRTAAGSSTQAEVCPERDPEAVVDSARPKIGVDKLAKRLLFQDSSAALP